MAHDFALIPCEICNNLFTLDEYMTHAATHQQPSTYSGGTMYGPLPKPKGYQDPHPQSVVTNDDYSAASGTAVDYTAYTVGPDGDIQYNTGNMYGSKKQTETIEDTKNPMEDEKKHEIQDISQSDANSMRDIGCVVIKNGVRKDIIQNALRLINNALSDGPQCLAHDEYTKHNDILDLFNESAAFSLCQNVLGSANVIIPKMAEIKLLFPEKVATNEPKTQWTIDGLQHGELAPYSLGMRCILTKQTFAFYKGTHNESFAQMKANGIDAFVDTNKDATHRTPWDSDKNALIKWDVDKGDIVLYHPFLCVPIPETTATENIDYYVTFRVNHKHFSKAIGTQRAQHLWLGFENLKDALIDEKLSI